MAKFRIAIKAFIIKDGNVLLLQRSSKEVHKPGVWDIPGGRLESGEDPHHGVQREVEEEIGISAVEILLPLDAHHFVRDDGQIITMIIFLCTVGDEAITLSEAHQHYQWAKIDDDTVPEWLHPVVANYKKYNLETFV